MHLDDLEHEQVQTHRANFTVLATDDAGNQLKLEIKDALITETRSIVRCDAALRDIVHRELAAGVENGYPLDTWTAEAIADDLARCSPALDDRDPEALVPHVKE
jgi:hypothetical protein